MQALVRLYILPVNAHYPSTNIAYTRRYNRDYA